MAARSWTSLVFAVYVAIGSGGCAGTNEERMGSLILTHYESNFNFCDARYTLDWFGDDAILHFLWTTTLFGYSGEAPLSAGQYEITVGCIPMQDHAYVWWLISRVSATGEVDIVKCSGVMQNVAIRPNEQLLFRSNLSPGQKTAIGEQVSLISTFNTSHVPEPLLLWVE